VLSAAVPLSGTLRVDGVLLTVRGEVDTETAPVLQALLEEAVALGTGTVTVDLAGVTFMDARGLSALVHARVELSAANRHLAVQAAPAALVRLFEVTGLTRVLGVQLEATAAVLPVLASTASLPLTQDLLDAALHVIVTMAQAVIGGADGASITLPRQGLLGTVAASNDVVREMDTDQYDTGQGPCLDAATQGERFHISSLDAEGRWPEFVPRARARGIRSILSTPLMHEDSTLGALNIYSSSVDAFARHEQEWADKFAEGAAAVITRAHSGLVGQDLQLQLQQALASREVIALAQGLTMSRVGGTPAEAHAVLRDVGLRTNQSLLEVCRSVVALAGPPAARNATGGDHAADTG
jgi:anti-anti-sigma factor